MRTVREPLSVVLRNPGVHAVRAGLRDAWWTVRGSRRRNPPIPARVRTLLFICKGNICRSPFTARLAAQLFARAGMPQVRCVSAGFAATDSTPSPKAARESAAARHVPLDDHRAAILSESELAEADMILVMEVAHVELLAARHPGLRDRLFLLPLFGGAKPPVRGYRRFNLADPYGKSRAVFDACYDDAVGQVEALVRAVTAAAGAGAFGDAQQRRS